MKNTSVIVLSVLAAVLAAFALTTPSAASEEAVTANGADGVVAYYFHGNVRCATCRKIEALTDEALHAGFAEALDNGSLRWNVVNIDEEANKHFIDDFQLTTRSVVLAEYRDGKVVRWKNLDKVWQLVRNQDAFAEYITGETSAFLGEG